MCDNRDQPTPNRKRARSEPELLKTLKKPQDLYEAARALDSPSRTSRIMFRKAGNAMAGPSVELAGTKSATEALRSQLQDSNKGQRKRVTIDPNQTFADVDSIRNAQKAVAAAELARKAKIKSDKELKLASEQAGSSRMEDMVLEFQT
jgi:FKBP-type peptidyl-prolyl cis-trans isomerase 2